MRVLGEELVEGGDGLVDVLARDEERRKEAQHGVVRAVDDDVAAIMPSWTCLARSAEWRSRPSMRPAPRTSAMASWCCLRACGAGR